MSEKNSNEITIRINVSREEFIAFLLNNHFQKKETFSLDDYYFIPKETKLDKTMVREILAKSIIIRNIKGEHTCTSKLTYKMKDINAKGEIVSQKAINCNIYDKEEAKIFLQTIGYVEIMNIKEEDIVYSNGDIEVAVKYVDNGEILVEIETDCQYDTVDKLIEKVKELQLPIDDSDYYVKKAEEYLKKMIGCA